MPTDPIKVGHNVTVFPPGRWKCSCGYRGEDYGFGGDYDRLHPERGGEPLGESTAAPHPVSLAVEALPA